MAGAENASGRERKLQALVTAYIVTGLFFLLLPGTLLGVWNLISISNRRALDQLSPAWLQASWPCADLWLDRDFHSGDRILLALEDGPEGALCAGVGMGLPRAVDDRPARALVVHHHCMALANPGSVRLDP